MNSLEFTKIQNLRQRAKELRNVNPKREVTSNLKTIQFKAIVSQYNAAKSLLQAKKRDQILFTKNNGLESCAKVYNTLLLDLKKHNKFIQDHPTTVRKTNHTTIPNKRRLIEWLLHAIDSFKSPEWFESDMNYIEKYLEGCELQREEKKKQKVLNSNFSPNKKNKIEE